MLSKNVSFCEREFVMVGVKYAKSVVRLKASKHWLRIFNFLNVEVVSKTDLACQPSVCLFVFCPYLFVLPSLFVSALMTGRHSAMSWRQWSRISWRRGRLPLACWLYSRSQTSWPPACPPCIPLHRKEAWRRSTWVSGEVNECVRLFDLSPATSLHTMSNRAYASANFWTQTPVGFLVEYNCCYL